MKNKLLALAFVPFMATSMPKQHVHEFAPENNLKIPVSMNLSGITEEDFNSALDKVEAIYAPIIASHKAKLVVARYWSNDTVNAYAEQDGFKWIISMFGGLARHPEVTKDGFTLVACHELGHHVGGFPKRGWASNEGESDYYGTLKCLHRVWGDEDNVGIVANMTIDTAAKIACESQWSNAADAALCQRSAMAGKSLARLLAQLMGTQEMPEFETPDKNKVDETVDYHPAAQCRLDTYFAGSLCTVDFNIDVDDVDPTVGVCAFGETGGRPACWFNLGTKPTPEEPETNPKVSDRRY